MPRTAPSPFTGRPTHFRGCTHKPLEWYAVDIRCANRSAFNGYRWTPSDYSGVRCCKCGTVRRTKAAYVERIPDTPAWYRPYQNDERLIEWRKTARVLRPFSEIGRKGYERPSPEVSALLREAQKVKDDE